jgi:transketolase
MEIVSRPHLHNLVRFAADRPELLVLSADLTSSCEAQDFRQAYPDRFFSMGMAEQNMMGFAAGLAREGFQPFVHTFAVFICRRPFDQVAMSIAYPNLPVRLLGFLPGITTPGGVTHQATDDIALMRVLPNMTVLSCGDATEVESALPLAAAQPGPVYVRMLRKDVPRLFPADQPMALDRVRVLSEGEDVAILTEGICTAEAMRLIPRLQARGVGVLHLHVSTLKPFRDPVVDRAFGVRHGVITLENHSVIGGLGSAVAERMAEAGCGRRLVRLGLQDVYAHGASLPWLQREYGLDAAALLAAVEDLLGHGLDIDVAQLPALPEPPARVASDPEDL